MATTMRFLIVGQDVSGSRAFDKFQNSVERANKTVDRQNKSLIAADKANRQAAVGVASVTAAFTGFDHAATAASSKTSIFVKSIAALNLATGVLEPAMAGVVVVAGALTSAMVSGAAGLAGYAAAAGPVVKMTGEVLKAQQQAAQGIEQAGKAAEVLKQTPPVVRKFAASVQDALNTYQQWAKALAAPVLRPFSNALKLVHPLLADLTPFTLAAADALSKLTAQMRRAVTGTGFQEWLSRILPNVEPVIVHLGHILGNIAVGIGGIAEAFAPVVKTVIGGLDAMTKKFADWGRTLSQHTGFQSLMDTFRQSTPLAVQVLKNLGAVIVNITRAMASLATPANSKALLQILMPVTSLLRVLSANQQLARTVLYITALAAILRKIRPLVFGVTAAFTSWKAGETGIGRLIRLNDQLRAGFSSSVAAGLPITGLAGTIGGVLRKAADRAGVAITNMAAGATKGGAAATLLGRGLLFLGTGAAGAAAAVVGAAAAGGLLAIAIRHADDATVDFVNTLRAQSDATGFNIAGYEKFIGAIKTARTETVQYRAAIEQQSISAVGQQRQLIANAHRQEVLTQAQSAAVTQARNMNEALTVLAGRYHITIPQAAELAVKAGVQADAFQRGGRITAEASRKIQAYTAAARLSHNPAAQVARDLDIIGNNAADANSQLAALNETLAVLVGNYNDTVTAGLAARQSLADLAKAAKQSGDRTGFATQNQRDLTQALTGTTKSTLEASSATFKQTHNVKASIKPLADEVQQIVNLGLKGPIAKRTTDNLVGAIIKLGEKGGWSENKIATLIARILKIPKSAAWRLIMQGTGRWSVQQINKSRINRGIFPVGGLAGGGPVRGPGSTTSDRAGLFRLSNREYVVKAAAADKYGPKRMAAVNAGTASVYAPGLAAGGPARADLRGNLDVLSGKFAYDDYRDTWQGLRHDVLNAMAAEMTRQVRAALGGGMAVARFAAKFATGLNHPYVWGGMTPSGWDCSGFTSYVLNHFGYTPPRTSEAQYGWVKRTGDQPGALAFFRSPAGGPPPGHVGISLGDGRMANANSTPVGTIISSTAGNMGFGIPPGGWHMGGGIAAGGHFTDGQLERLWTGAGGPGRIAHLMAAIAMAESGGRANAIGPATPFGRAKGLWQILGQLVPGNIFAPTVNAANAVAKYRLQGLAAWAAYTNGSYRQFLSDGGHIREPVKGIGLRSGMSYDLGEAGTEYVSSQADLKQVAVLLQAVLVELRRQTPHLASGPERAGAAVAAGLNGTARRAALMRGSSGG